MTAKEENTVTIQCIRVLDTRGFRGSLVDLQESERKRAYREIHREVDKYIQWRITEENSYEFEGTATLVVVCDKNEPEVR